MTTLAMKSSSPLKPTMLNFCLKTDKFSRSLSDFLEDIIPQVYYKKETVTKTANSLIEEEKIAVTLDIETPLDTHLKRKERLIMQRNEILNSLISQHLPWNKKKLNRIDTQLDQIDMKIYELESKKQHDEIKKILSKIEDELDRLKNKRT